MENRGAGQGREVRAKSASLGAERVRSDSGQEGAASRIKAGLGRA